MSYLSVNNHSDWIASLVVLPRGASSAWRIEPAVSQGLTYPDTLITDTDTKNAIIGYETAYAYVENAYYSGGLTYAQKTEQQNELIKAMDLARADFVVLNPQSDYVYQYFKGRNYQTGDICPFNRTSYTYNASNPITGFDVIIIQRSLELLTYFEPPNEYEYGIYDQETHNAVLSSPYYILGSNDFQKYSYYDMLGSTTVAQRTKSAVQVLQKMRFIHNSVAAWVATKVTDSTGVGRTTQTTIYKSHNPVKWGFADVMKTTSSAEYIWEVKPWDSRYRMLNGMAAIQLGGYITAWNTVSQPQYTPHRTAIAGYNVGKFAFNLAGQTIVVESNSAPYPDIRSGLVHYYPTKSQQEYQTQYALEYALETVPIPVPAPTYSYNFGSSWSFGNMQINGVAQVAGVVVLVVVIAGVIYFCPPAAVAGLAFV